MYKLLLFLKKSDDDHVLTHFNEFTLKYLSELSGEKVKLGKVESSLLLDKKYSHFCEFEVAGKDEMDKLLNSKPGKGLNKDLMNFHEYIDLIFVDYN